MKVSMKNWINCARSKRTEKADTKLEQKERDLTGIKSLKIRYNRVFGYYIEVTKSNLRYCPKDVLIANRRLPIRSGILRRN